jgi:hypothetical protein
MHAQLINILTLGAADGKGCFFPNGLLGEIVTPTGYNATASGTTDFPPAAPVAGQVHSPHRQMPSAGRFAEDISCRMSGLDRVNTHLHIMPVSDNNLPAFRS